MHRRNDECLVLVNVIEVLIRMVQADGKTEDNELVFLLKIRESLKNLTDEKLMARFPRHLDLLIGTANYGSTLKVAKFSLPDHLSFN